jgi:signal transduction histidine kinase/ActR/RegA family two-component response regulator
MTAERAAWHSRRLMLASDITTIGAAAIDAVLDLCDAQAAVAWLPVVREGAPRQIESFAGGELLDGTDATQFAASSEEQLADLLLARGALAVRTTDASRSARLSVGWREPAGPTASAVAGLELVAGHVSAMIERTEADRLLAATRAELRDVEAQVKRTRRVRAVGELASGIVHDFNNCLTTILGFTELALGPLEKADAFFDDLTTIRTATLDAAALVRRLRTVSRPPDSALEREVVDVREIVRAMPRLALPRWSRQAQCDGLPFDIVVDVGPVPPIYVAVAEIRELLLNLIFNAVDAMPNGGRITIATREVDDEAEISVSDQGVGMSAETMKHVFEPFFTTKGDRGSGLGLSVCRSIAEGHGGRLSVASTLGAGSTFALRIPPAPAELLKPMPSVANDVQAETGRRRVLLVDDQPEVRNSIGEMLRALGHQVALAADGNAALTIALRQRLDVVITDFGMPGMNGIELARRLRTVAPTSSVVLLTGWGLDTTDAALENVTNILYKPVTMTLLAQALTDSTKIAVRGA